MTLNIASELDPTSALRAQARRPALYFARACRTLTLSYLAFAAASCSLDSSPVPPRTGANETPPTWRPTGAVARSARAASELDAEIQMTASRSVRREKDAGQADAAEPSIPVRARTAGSGAAMPADTKSKTDASASPVAADASVSVPEMPPARDASMPSVDAARPRDPGPAGAPSPPQNCKPGVYAGTFSGSLYAIGLPVSTVTGAINANLTLDLFGLYLNVRDLMVVGSDESGNTLTVSVSGNINCTTLQLEDGLLENGNYYMVGTGTAVQFVGVAAGTYRMSPYSINGTWSVEAQDSILLGGDGGFSLVLVN